MYDNASAACTYSEEIAPVVEFFRKDDAHALSGERRLCEVTVVSLAIAFQTDFAVWCKQPLKVEVAHKVCICKRIVAVAEVSVNQKSVV